MSSPDRPLLPRAAVGVLAPCWRFVAYAWLALLCCPARVPAQDRQSPLRLDGPSPGGVRKFVTESWGTYDFSVTNFGDTDRRARVLLSHKGQPDVWYGRDVWVPAHATLSTWMLVGPPGLEKAVPRHEVEVLLYDRTTGEDHWVPLTGEERIHTKGMNYQPPAPPNQPPAITTALLLDDAAPETPGFGELPRPESRETEALRLARTFRRASGLKSEQIQQIAPGPLPATAEGYDGIHHVLLASRRIADDPAGAQALRHWLQRGGRLWVMLDKIEPEALAPLLGEALDFQVVDHVGLTDFEVETQTSGLRTPGPEPQHHERPVEFVRVLLPPGERAQHLINSSPVHLVNGWPVWFMRRVGKGKVVFTTLGPRGLYGKNHPDHPAPLPPLEAITKEMQPARETFPAEAFEPALTEEIGYSVVRRGTVGLVFAAFLLATLALGLLLRRSRRPELLGWLAPAAALGAAGVLVLLGELSRRAVPPTVATAQVVNAVSGTSEAEVHGLVAVYRPDAGPADAAAEQGGFFNLDMAGVEGKIRRRVQTDMDAWHWEDLGLPAGVRLAPYRRTVRTGEPMTAVARLGPDGLEGKLTAGPYTRDLADAVISTPGSRSLAVRLRPDGSFRAGPADVLPVGQFLSGAVLSDRQQGRQKLYRKFLLPLKEGRPNDRTVLLSSKNERPDDRTVLLAWASPVETHFQRAALPLDHRPVAAGDDRRPRGRPHRRVAPGGEPAGPPPRRDRRETILASGYGGRPEPEPERERAAPGQRHRQGRRAGREVDDRVPRTRGQRPRGDKVNPPEAPARDPLARRASEGEQPCLRANPSSRPRN
ncbi:MAG: hypothetical protein HYS12_12685 [Planctomycetes bacterium]|nr:hypothetical protein [Planctomycetota bacterium]